MRKVTPMSIYADPDGMREVILKCISKLRSKMAYIKAEYTNAVKCLSHRQENFAVRGHDHRDK